MTGKKQIRLFDVAAEMATQLGAKYRDIGRDRDELLEFMDANDWFAMEKSGKGMKIQVCPFESVEKSLETWLLAYHQSPEVKLAVMLDAYRDALPQTCTLYRAFIEKKQLGNVKSSWQLLDYLLCVLERDITNYSEEGLRELLDSTKGNLSVASRTLFMSFLENGNNGKPISHWQYQIQKEEIISLSTTAYSLRQFSVMAYCIFNEESWDIQSLVEKAASSKKFANLWLFTALHFVSALRMTDLRRLPVPPLPYAPKILRERILARRFSGQEAATLTKEVIFRLQVKPLKPNKTRRYGSIPDLKLFIPESLLSPLGIIMALSLSFREPNDPFVLPEQGLRDIQKFFGHEFSEAVQNKRFLTRRANKAYLQGIELAAMDEPGKPKGYMLAALARSHKGGLGRLPEITDIYLRDATFSGYRPEFILREMFERGIFGFIPATLLEAYSGRSYGKLSVHHQTKLIRMIGLDAVQIEDIALMTEKSLVRARDMVSDIVSHLDGDRTKLGTVLQKIASGAAPSRQPEYLCLRVAAGYACTSSERSACIGCGYEIYTKAALHLLMKEYARLNTLRINTDKAAAVRYGDILDKGVLPAISSMLAQMGALYPDADMEPMLDIVERGMVYADSTEQRRM